jgi:hypothetical protein
MNDIRLVQYVSLMLTVVNELTLNLPQSFAKKDNLKFTYNAVISEFFKKGEEYLTETLPKLTEDIENIVKTIQDLMASEKQENQDFLWTKYLKKSLSYAKQQIFGKNNIADYVSLKQYYGIKHKLAMLRKTFGTSLFGPLTSNFQVNLRKILRFEEKINIIASPGLLVIRSSITPPTKSEQKLKEAIESLQSVVTLYNNAIQTKFNANQSSAILLTSRLFTEITLEICSRCLQKLKLPAEAKKQNKITYL